MQTILGSGGTIGVALARILPSYTDQVRLVSRTPKKVNQNDELVSADLTDEAQVMRAVEGSDVAYLTVGLPYSANVWSQLWPRVVRLVISACKKYQTRLVFFDNVYMYDPNHLHHMDEGTPINPSSKKGKVRADIAGMILDEIAQSDLKALIARCADFYGPGIEKNGMIREMVFKPLVAGKKANWLCSLKYKHSVTYVPDAALATALLGNTKDAYNQVWHLPTAPDPPTGKEWIATIASSLGVAPRSQVAPKFLVRMMGWYDPLMKEMVEMLYQYDRDYNFLSKKFKERFNVIPTSYSEGIKEIVQKDYR